MYNKKQYCLYCKMGVVKIVRHFERAHQNKQEVAQALSFPKGSKQRRMHLKHLRNRGNFAHNVAGAGDLVPRKLPKQDSNAQNFLHSSRLFYKETSLAAHVELQVQAWCSTKTWQNPCPGPLCFCFTSTTWC